MKSLPVFLAIFPADAQEVHIKWEGHETVESAKTELNKIREMMILDNKIPMDCYVYQAEKPPFDLPVYNLDDVDFNFYREKSPEEIRKSQERFDQVMQLVEKTKDSVQRAEELAMSLKDKLNKVPTETANA
jgi:hypothetical protein